VRELLIEKEPSELIFTALDGKMQLPNVRLAE
jgi:hypothetical protein